jgi:hypothetical protein
MEGDQRSKGRSEMDGRRSKGIEEIRSGRKEIR